MDGPKIDELKHFIEQCKSNPSILHKPCLAFFKTYLQSLGARIPADPESVKTAADLLGSNENMDAKKPSSSSDDKLDDEIVESDIELDDIGVVEPDIDLPQLMGDSSIEVTEENQDASQVLKLKAVDAISQDKLDEALDHLTEAIMLNPNSAILYATRANVYVKLKKPNAAIRDASAALQINPDSAKGYKARGMARAMLGLWEEAASDLHLASNLDYDEEIGFMLKKVEPNVRKLEEHRRKYERRRKEKESQRLEWERQQRRAEAQAAYERDNKVEHPSGTKSSDADAANTLKDGHVMEIHTASDLDTKLKAASGASRLSILYFTASWCGPCRFISPLYTSLAAKYTNVSFLKVDIDQASDVARRWNISSVPTFFFIKNGKEVDKIVGADKNSLERKIFQHAGQ